MQPKHAPQWQDGLTAVFNASLGSSFTCLVFIVLLLPNLLDSESIFVFLAQSLAAAPSLLAIRPDDLQHYRSAVVKLAAAILAGRLASFLAVAADY